MGGGAFNPRPKERTRLIPLWVDVALGSAAGIVSASCAAPFILTVDRAVTENSAGKSALGPALLSGLKEFALRPHRLLTSLPFAMVAGVYGATYATANSIDAICERALDVDSESAGMVHGAVKLITVTAVNMGSGVAKDAAFARMFGAGGAKPPPVPMVSYGIFCFRDLLTISAAFTIPPLLTQALVSSGTMEEKRAASAAQLLSPIGMQIVLTPIHLLALNLYNQPGATPGERAKAVGSVLPGSTVARMGRFGCAYGIGGLLNTSLTKRARDWAEATYCSRLITKKTRLLGRRPSDGPPLA